ncbi:hypothetical protein [Agromyces sp. CCNWLW203]|uniref:hypothetical protein n=1 Tax=Agromyces sp. CCNWLW203 TaxID=3112842 RepID=UPI002F96B377
MRERVPAGSAAPTAATAALVTVLMAVLVMLVSACVMCVAVPAVCEAVPAVTLLPEVLCPALQSPALLIAAHGDEGLLDQRDRVDRGGARGIRP